jgi:hypothetical protein
MYAFSPLDPNSWLRSEHLMHLREITLPHLAHHILAGKGLFTSKENALWFSNLIKRTSAPTRRIACTGLAICDDSKSISTHNLPSSNSQMKSSLYYNKGITSHSCVQIYVRGRTCTTKSAILINPKANGRQHICSFIQIESRTPSYACESEGVTDCHGLSQLASSNVLNHSDQRDQRNQHNRCHRLHLQCSRQRPDNH